MSIYTRDSEYKRQLVEALLAMLMLPSPFSYKSAIDITRNLSRVAFGDLVSKEYVSCRDLYLVGDIYYVTHKGKEVLLHESPRQKEV